MTHGWVWVQSVGWTNTRVSPGAGLSWAGDERDKGESHGPPPDEPQGSQAVFSSEAGWQCGWGRALPWWAVGQAQGRAGNGEGQGVWLQWRPHEEGIRPHVAASQMPSQELWTVSSSSSQHLLSDHSVPGSSQGAEL